jgi:hypothetical protein
MHPADQNAAPARPILTKLLVRDWEYGHRRVLLGVRLASGVVNLSLGLFMLRCGKRLGLVPLAGAVVLLWFGPRMYRLTKSQP